jgi:hypothetical protein
MTHGCYELKEKAESYGQYNQICIAHLALYLNINLVEYDTPHDYRWEPLLGPRGH